MQTEHEQIAAAEAMQLRLRAQVSQTDSLPPEIYRVAGVDVAYDKDSDRVAAAIAVLEPGTWKLVDHAEWVGRATFPYIPGLFSFRELPAVLEALKRLSTPPELILCDGQGRAHPRQFGLACHLGLETGIPSLGCGKTRLYGTFSQPGNNRGDRNELMDPETGEVLGMALRTQPGVNPVFVSVGHKISLETACEWVIYASPHFRLPETTRMADHLCREALRTAGSGA